MIDYNNVTPDDVEKMSPIEREAFFRSEKYWGNLRHQATIAAMQSLIAAQDGPFINPNSVVDNAIAIANMLIQKMRGGVTMPEQ